MDNNALKFRVAMCTLPNGSVCLFSDGGGSYTGLPSSLGGTWGSTPASLAAGNISGFTGGYGGVGYMESTKGVSIPTLFSSGLTGSALYTAISDRGGLSASGFIGETGVHLSDAMGGGGSKRTDFLEDAARRNTGLSTAPSTWTMADYKKGGESPDTTKRWSTQRRSDGAAVGQYLSGVDSRTLQSTGMPMYGYSFDPSSGYWYKGAMKGGAWDAKSQITGAPSLKFQESAYRIGWVTDAERAMYGPDYSKVTRLGYPAGFVPAAKQDISALLGEQSPPGFLPPAPINPATDWSPIWKQGSELSQINALTFKIFGDNSPKHTTAVMNAILNNGGFTVTYDGLGNPIVKEYKDAKSVSDAIYKANESVLLGIIKSAKESGLDISYNEAYAEAEKKGLLKTTESIFSFADVDGIKALGDANVIIKPQDPRTIATAGISLMTDAEAEAHRMSMKEGRPVFASEVLANWGYMNAAIKLAGRSMTPAEYADFARTMQKKYGAVEIYDSVLSDVPYIKLRDEYERENLARLEGGRPDLVGKSDMVDAVTDIMGKYNVDIHKAAHIMNWIASNNNFINPYTGKSYNWQTVMDAANRLSIEGMLQVDIPNTTKPVNITTQDVQNVMNAIGAFNESGEGQYVFDGGITREQVGGAHGILCTPDGKESITFRDASRPGSPLVIFGAHTGNTKLGWSSFNNMGGTAAGNSLVFREAKPDSIKEYFGSIYNPAYKAAKSRIAAGVGDDTDARFVAKVESNTIDKKINWIRVHKELIKEAKSINYQLYEWYKGGDSFYKELANNILSNDYSRFMEGKPDSIKETFTFDNFINDYVKSDRDEWDSVRDIEIMKGLGKATLDSVIDKKKRGEALTPWENRLLEQSEMYTQSDGEVNHYLFFKQVQSEVSGVERFVGQPPSLMGSIREYYSKYPDRIPHWMVDEVIDVDGSIKPDLGSVNTNIIESLRRMNLLNASDEMQLSGESVDIKVVESVEPVGQAETLIESDAIRVVGSKCDDKGGIGISDVRVEKDGDTVSIMWETEKPSNSIFMYCVGDGCSSIKDDKLVTSHRIELNVNDFPETAKFTAIKSRQDDNPDSLDATYTVEGDGFKIGGKIKIETGVPETSVSDKEPTPTVIVHSTSGIDSYLRGSDEPLSPLLLNTEERLTVQGVKDVTQKYNVVIVQIGAGWCRGCHEQMKSAVGMRNAWGNTNEDYAYVYLDYDSNEYKTLLSQDADYKFTSLTIPVTIIFVDGKRIGSEVVGGQTMSMLNYILDRNNVEKSEFVPPASSGLSIPISELPSYKPINTGTDIIASLFFAAPVSGYAGEIVPPVNSSAISITGKPDGSYIAVMRDNSVYFISSDLQSFDSYNSPGDADKGSKWGRCSQGQCLIEDRRIADSIIRDIKLAQSKYPTVETTQPVIPLVSSVIEDSNISMPSLGSGAVNVIYNKLLNSVDVGKDDKGTPQYIRMDGYNGWDSLPQVVRDVISRSGMEGYYKERDNAISTLEKHGLVTDGNVDGYKVGQYLENLRYIIGGYPWQDMPSDTSSIDATERIAEKYTKNQEEVNGALEFLFGGHSGVSSLSTVIEPEVLSIKDFERKVVGRDENGVTITMALVDYNKLPEKFRNDIDTLGYAEAKKIYDQSIDILRESGFVNENGYIAVIPALINSGLISEDNKRKWLENMHARQQLNAQNGDVNKIGITEAYKIPIEDVWSKLDKDRAGVAISLAAKDLDGLKRLNPKKYEVANALSYIAGDDELVKTWEMVQKPEFRTEQGQAMTKQVWQAMTPWEEEKGEYATPLGVAQMGAEIFVPYVYVALHKDEMTATESAFWLGVDTLLLLTGPIRMVSTLRRAGSPLLRASLLTGEAYMKAPYYMVRHPMQTGRFVYGNIAEMLSTQRGMYELYTHSMLGNKLLTQGGHDLKYLAGFGGAREGATRETAEEVNRALLNGTSTEVMFGKAPVKVVGSGLVDVYGFGKTQAPAMVHSGQGVGMLTELSLLNQLTIKKGEQTMGLPVVFGTPAGLGATRFYRGSAGGRRHPVQIVWLHSSDSLAEKTPGFWGKFRENDKYAENIIKQYEKGLLDGKVVFNPKQYNEFIEAEMAKVAGGEKIIPVPGKELVVNWKEPNVQLAKEADVFLAKAKYEQKKLGQMIKNLADENAVKAQGEKVNNLILKYIEKIEEAVKKGTEKSLSLNIDHQIFRDMETMTDVIVFHTTDATTLQAGRVKPISGVGSNIKGKMVGWRNVIRDIFKEPVRVQNVSSGEQIRRARLTLTPAEKERHVAGFDVWEGIKSHNVDNSGKSWSMGDVPGIPKSAVNALDDWLRNSDIVIGGGSCSKAHNPNFRAIKDVEGTCANPNREVNIAYNEISKHESGWSVVSDMAQDGEPIVRLLDPTGMPKIELREPVKKTKYEMFEVLMPSNEHTEISGIKFRKLQDVMGDNFDSILRNGYGSPAVPKDLEVAAGRGGKGFFGPFAAHYEQRIKDIDSVYSNSKYIIDEIRKYDPVKAGILQKKLDKFIPKVKGSGLPIMPVAIGAGAIATAGILSQDDMTDEEKASIVGAGLFGAVGIHGGMKNMPKARIFQHRLNEFSELFSMTDKIAGYPNKVQKYVDEMAINVITGKLDDVGFKQWANKWNKELGFNWNTKQIDDMVQRYDISYGRSASKAMSGKLTDSEYKDYIKKWHKYYLDGDLTTKQVDASLVLYKKNPQKVYDELHDVVTKKYVYLFEQAKLNEANKYLPPAAQEEMKALMRVMSPKEQITAGTSNEIRRLIESIYGDEFKNIRSMKAGANLIESALLHGIMYSSRNEITNRELGSNRLFVPYTEDKYSRIYDTEYVRPHVITEYPDTIGRVIHEERPRPIDVEYEPVPYDRVHVENERVQHGVLPRVETPPRPPAIPPRPPAVPPRPPAPPPPKLKNALSKLRSDKGLIAWKQGFIYKVLWPPYGQEDILNTKRPVEGVDYKEGLRSAYDSIVKRSGEIPPIITRDMGIYDVGIITPEGKRKPELQFKRDERLTYKGKKVGKTKARNKVKAGVIVG